MHLHAIRRRVVGPILSARSISRLSSSLQRGAPIDIHPEVQDALEKGKPVVALETALTTHGLPHPINEQVTKELELVVRSTGCIPATIGIVAGRIKIGLENSDLERLADVQRTPRTSKISRRDIAPALAMKADGGTTISATLIFAALAGIRVFATGGLGGVHRGGETSMDVSADLHDLARCPVGLVSGGIKSILDIGRYVAYRSETLGVPVIPYSKSRDFPAFFSPRSGLETPWNVNDPETAARILYTQWQLGMDSGALIAVPIPEEYAAKGEIIQQAVDQAVRESEENGISKRGKDATPWLLSRVADLTKHGSIDSNIALLKNSALIGGQIAAQYQVLANQSTRPAEKTYAGGVELQKPSALTSAPAKVLVIGSSALDISAQAQDVAEGAEGAHSTSPGSVKLTLGGVARNIAEACTRMGEPALLISPIGKDAWGRLLYEETEAIGMRTDGFVKRDEQTAVCNLFLSSTGNLVGGVADMRIAEELDMKSIQPHIAKNNPTMIAFDGNLSSDTIKDVVLHCVERNITSDEPTSIIKSEKILGAIQDSLRGSSEPPVTFFTPNLLELQHVHRKASSEWELTSSPAWWSAVDKLSLGDSFRRDLARLARRRVHDDEEANTLAFLVDHGVAQMAVALTPFFRNIFIKCGDKGVVVVMRFSGKNAAKSAWVHEQSDPAHRHVVAHGDSGHEILVLKHFSPHPTPVLNTTGAGDSFVGALLASLQAQPHALSTPAGLHQLVTACQNAAALTLRSPLSVSPSLNTLAP
ncbi:indigoidine synthase A-like protein [Mycena belliarum]|uniref:Indigoidine synthase A-like protein n=1 Tax=Mycena belliarum TaxID=1033014 RepID=A0AAD6XXY2_9AGAR|nr:indigoidine synthase A-like protein [Mycena belliae]